MQRKILLIVLLISVAEVTFSQKKFNEDRLLTAKKIIQLIETKNYEEVKNSFPDSISKSIPDNALKYYIDLGSQFIDEYGIPEDESLMTKVNIVPTKTETILVNSIIFPFPATKEKHTMPKRIIEVGFIEKYGNNKIISLRVVELKPPPTPKDIKYLDKLDFKTDSISNWRIYYSKGNIINNNRNVFAVSGDLEKMKKLKIEKEIKDIFTKLSKAPIKEKSYPNDVIRFNGRPEYIVFTWENKNDNKSYRIEIIINKEKGVDELLNNFVIVSTFQFVNQPTVYYVEKSEVSNITKILTDFSNKDWKENYEINP